jgi:hypothetical protein
MLGTAGIGMFLLRVSGCAIPSVLLPSPAHVVDPTAIA